MLADTAQAMITVMNWVLKIFAMISLAYSIILKLTKLISAAFPWEARLFNIFIAFILNELHPWFSQQHLRIGVQY